MKSFLKRKYSITGILFIIVFIVVLLIPSRSALVFYHENTKQIEAFLPLREGDTFQIVFKHSIHLTDVAEKYVIQNNGDIRQYEIVYEEFGIGMPSNALEGETFVYEDGKYHIKDLNNIFPSINVRNGKTVSETRLLWRNNGEHFVWFNDYFQPGAWFTIKTDKISLWQYMKGVKIHE